MRRAARPNAVCLANLRARRACISDNHPERAGIESDEVANYCFPKTWPKELEQRARIIGDWLRAGRGSWLEDGPPVQIPQNRHGNDFVIPLVAAQRYLVFEGCIKCRPRPDGVPHPPTPDAAWIERAY
jgi:hypothetical protein